MNCLLPGILPYRATVKSSMAWRGSGVRIPSAPQNKFCRLETVPGSSTMSAAQLGEPLWESIMFASPVMTVSYVGTQVFEVVIG